MGKITDVKSRDYLLDDRRVSPVFRNKVKALLTALRAKGFPIIVVEAYRSKARALQMKVTGKSKNGMKSRHCVGKAVDCCFLINGKLSWDVPPSYWEAYGKGAEAFGLTWGGRWKSFPDQNHIELS